MVVPKLRFKEFSEDYNFSKFQEASIQIIDGDRGNNYPKSDDFYDNEYCLFLNAGNVTKSGFKFESTQFINKEKDALLRKGKLQKNDLVITTRGTVGNIAYFDESIPFENIRINSGMVIARSEIDVEPIYLNQFLKSDLFEKWLEKNVFGSAQPQLTVKLLNSISISYPSKAEQTKIATFLSAVDEKISQLSQKHQLLSQYKQGMMQKLFSQQIRFKADDGNEFEDWENKILGDIAFTTTGSSNREDSTELSGEYTFFDRSEDIRTSTKYLFDCEALIIPGEGSSFKPKYFMGKFDLHQRAYAVMQFKNVLAKFLYFSMQYNHQYFQSVAVGSTVKSLRLPMFQNMPIKLPALAEQTKIANFLSSIDQKIDVISEQLEQAKLWKKGLLQQMFV